MALLKSASAARDALQAQNASLQRECARLAEAAEQAEAVGEAGQQLRDDLDTSRAEAASLESQLDAASSELERLRGAALMLASNLHVVSGNDKVVGVRWAWACSMAAH